MSNNSAILYRCPNCGCLIRDTDEHSTGFNFKRAFIVSLFFGKIIGGLSGLRSSNKFSTQCPRCGHSFTVEQ